MWYLVVDHIVQEMPIKVKMSRYIHSYHYYLRQTSTLSDIYSLIQGIF